MKKENLFFGIVLVFATFVMSAQPTIYEYTYDDNGNRTTREVIFLGTYKTSNNNSSQTNSFTKSEVAISYLLSHQISIYPNPTIGDIKIEVTGLEDKTGFIRVFSAEGKEILNMNLSVETELDLSNEPAGNYILQIEIEGKTRKWKIVKQ